MPVVQGQNSLRHHLKKSSIKLGFDYFGWESGRSGKFYPFNRSNLVGLVIRNDEVRLFFLASLWKRFIGLYQLPVNC